LGIFGNGKKPENALTGFFNGGKLGAFAQDVADAMNTFPTFGF
jgi:hypothetical protein